MNDPKPLLAVPNMPDAVLPTPALEPDPTDILDALNADAADERRYQLEAVMHDEDEGEVIELEDFGECGRRG